MTLARFNSRIGTDEIVAAVERHGACIVEDLLSKQTLSAIRAEIDPRIERTEPIPDDFAGRRTRRMVALVATCPTLRPVVLDRVALAAARRFLEPHCDRIQLGVTQIIAIGQGESAQALHRDRMVFGHLPAHIEPQFHVIWALTDFTRENGATRVVPGSPAWDAARVARPEEIEQAEMPAGSALFYSGTVIHGGGANRTSEARIGVSIGYCLGWLRQEENQYLSCPPEVAATLEPELSDLLGYTMGSHDLGYFASHRNEDQPGIMPPEMAIGRKPAAIGSLEKLEIDRHPAVAHDARP